MNIKFPILLIILVLVTLTSSCSFGRSGLSNMRVALDQAGDSETSTFFASDAVYGVADLNLDESSDVTEVVAKRIAVNVESLDPNSEILQETQRILPVGENSSSTISIYFQLSKIGGLPAGTHKVDLYLNGAFSQSVEFTVQ